MNYLEFDFKVNPVIPGNEIVMALLGEMEFESFEENEQGLKAYIRKDLFDGAALEESGLDALGGIAVSYTQKEIEQQNWNAVWESSFTAIDIDGQCMVRAAFHPAPAVGYDIMITPKMSFGTGHHQTTLLMIKHLLALDMQGRAVCDMGCGTAVLAILAEKKGAKHILAVDIDPWAYENSMENTKANSCQNITVKHGDIRQLGPEKFDIFIANINRNILLKDMESYAKACHVEGVLLLSGFFDVDAPQIMQEAEKQGFRYDSILVKDNWAAMKFIKS